MNKTLLLSAGLIAGALLLMPAPSLASSETWDERVASLNCEAWELPGWLDDSGLPTSCVNNEPSPGEKTPEPEVAPEPVAPVEQPVAPEAPAVEDEFDGC